RPVHLRLEPAIRVCRSRISIIYEDDIVTYEHTVFDCDALADEGMTGDLAIAPDRGSLLDFYKRSDLRPVADRAAVQIYKVINLDVAPKSDVIRYALTGRGVVSGC